MKVTRHLYIDLFVFISKTTCNHKRVKRPVKRPVIYGPIYACTKPTMIFIWAQENSTGIIGNEVSFEIEALAIIADEN